MTSAFSLGGAIEIIAHPFYLIRYYKSFISRENSACVRECVVRVVWQAAVMGGAYLLGWLSAARTFRGDGHALAWLAVWAGFSPVD